MKNLLLTSTHSKSNLAILISVIAVMLFSTVTTNAQDARLTVVTETHTSGKNFKGYMVTVYEDLMNNGDLSPIDQFIATSSKLKFPMKYNTTYMIDFATPADLHYTAEFDTHMATAKTAEDRVMEIDIDFDKLDANIYPNVIEKIAFNDKSADFAFIASPENKVQQAAVVK